MKRKTAWILLVALLGVMYILSSIPGLKVVPVLRHINSMRLGMDFTFTRVSQVIASRVPLDFGQLQNIDAITVDFLTYARDNPVVIEFFLRKLAHVAVFFFITVAIFFLLNQYMKKTSLAILISFIGGVIAGCIDEYRQTLIIDRVGSAVDVFIDVIGVTLAVFFIIFSIFITSSRQKYIKKEKDKKDKKTVLVS